MEDKDAVEDEKVAEERRACVMSDHCPNPCDPYIWDEEGENVVGYANCECNCCTGRCDCREWRKAEGDDDHICKYTLDE